MSQWNYDGTLCAKSHPFCYWSMKYDLTGPKLVSFLIGNHEKSWHHHELWCHRGVQSSVHSIFGAMKHDIPITDYEVTAVCTVMNILMAEHETWCQSDELWYHIGVQRNVHSEFDVQLKVLLNVEPRNTMTERRIMLHWNWCQSGVCCHGFLDCRTRKHDHNK